jgi:hypothetical protein
MSPTDPLRTIFKQYFGGVNAMEIIGKEGCQHRSEREEPYLQIPVKVKNSKTILDGLDSFVEGEMLENDNAYA